MPNDSASLRRTDANRRRLREALQSAFGSHINELKSSPTTKDPVYNDKLKEYRALNELMRTRGRSASPEAHFIRQGQLDQDLQRMSAFPNSSATDDKQKAHEERVIRSLATFLNHDSTETAILNAMGNPSDRSSKVRLSEVWVDVGEPGFRNLEVPLYLLADAEQESGTTALTPVIVRVHGTERSKWTPSAEDLTVTAYPTERYPLTDVDSARKWNKLSKTGDEWQIYRPRSPVSTREGDPSSSGAVSQ